MANANTAEVMGESMAEQIARLTRENAEIKAGKGVNNRTTAQLEAENKALRDELAKRSATKTLTLKIGQSGGMSVYGLGRFPVTLYKEQWARLLGHTDEIKAFLKAHDEELKSKF